MFSKSIVRPMSGVLVVCLVLMGITCMPNRAYASTTDVQDFKTLTEMAQNLGGDYAELGIDVETLLRILTYTSEDFEAPSGLQSAPQFNTQSLDIQVNTTSSGAGYINWINGVVNNMFLADPPSDNEARLRLDYIYEKFNSFYTASKYDSLEETYLRYLYISHFIDNPQYTYSGGSSVYHSSFANSYTHIISLNDISYYDSFLAYQQNAYLLDTVGYAVNAVNTIKSVIQNNNMTVADFTSAVGNEFQLVAQMEYEIVSTLTTTYDLSYDAASALYHSCLATLAQDYNNISVEDMQTRLYTQATDYISSDTPIDVVELHGTMFEAFQGIVNNTVMTRFAGGVIGAVCLSMDSLETAYHMGAVLNLAVSRHFRVADRMLIYYGLDPLP